MQMLKTASVMAMWLFALAGVGFAQNKRLGL